MHLVLQTGFTANLKLQSQTNLNAKLILKYKY